MFRNPSDDEIRRLLSAVRTIAVVGFSPKPERPSHKVALSMRQAGYRIFAVRPDLPEGWWGASCASLAELPETPDLVDVFRAPEHVAGIVEECVARGVKALWLQEGVVDAKAAQRAQAAGMTVVMDRCVWKAHQSLLP